MKFQNHLISAIIVFYSTIIEILRICFSAPLKRTSDRHKWDLGLRQKLPFAFRDFRNRTVVWIHAASLGESKLLIKFLETLHSKYPEDLYLVTATTREGVNYLHENKTASVCAAGFLPLDTISLMSLVLEHFSISRLWIVETELWPSLLWACRKKNVPIGIVNARIEEKTFGYYHYFKDYFSFLFQTVDVILAQTDEYATRYNLLGVNPSNIHIVGNIKGHITIKRPKRKDWLILRQALNIRDSDTVLTAGCIHAGEGAIIRDCYNILRQNNVIDRIIIIPRYLNESDALCEEIGGNIVTLSDTHTSRRWESCIINKTGILDDMYKLADIALVGGTFDMSGGHNVWDAARYGIPVFFGPNYSSQVDGCEMLLTSGVGFRADNAVDLAELIQRVMKKESGKFMHAQRLFSDTVNRRQSVLEPLIP